MHLKSTLFAKVATVSYSCIDFILHGQRCIDFIVHRHSFITKLIFALLTDSLNDPECHMNVQITK